MTQTIGLSTSKETSFTVIIKKERIKTLQIKKKPEVHDGPRGHIINNLGHYQVDERNKEFNFFKKT